MTFRLTPEAQARYEEAKAREAELKARFANLTNENLVSSVKLYMRNAEPKQFAPGEPVYDATLWHILLPELMRRVQRG